MSSSQAMPTTVTIGFSHVQCEPPEPVDGAYMYEDQSTNNSVNSVVKYVCVYTHVYSSGNLTRVCQEGGDWSGVLPVCRRDTSQATVVGGAITAFCLLLMILLPLDFIRYQRKRARVREISQRRSQNETKSRPTSFFIHKGPVDYNPYADPPPVYLQVTAPIEGGQPPEGKPPDNTTNVTIEPPPNFTQGHNKVILPPLKMPREAPETSIGTQADPPGHYPQLKKKKPKLIPRVRSMDDDETFNSALDNHSSVTDLVKPNDEGTRSSKRSKGKRKMRVDPLSEPAPRDLSNAVIPDHNATQPKPPHISTHANGPTGNEWRNPAFCGDEQRVIPLSPYRFPPVNLQPKPPEESWRAPAPVHHGKGADSPTNKQGVEMLWQRISSPELDSSFSGSSPMHGYSRGTGSYPPSPYYTNTQQCEIYDPNKQATQFGTTSNPGQRVGGSSPYYHQMKTPEKYTPLDTSVYGTSSMA